MVIYGNTARSYIEKPLKQARTVESDTFVASDTARFGMTRAELAKSYSKNGFTLATASNLFLDDTLSVGQKAGLLVITYEEHAKVSALYAARARFPSLRERLKVQAQQSKRIAQGLGRDRQLQRAW